MKQIRSDSLTAALDAALSANEIIEPPAHVSLRDGDRPFWDSIVNARASSAWEMVDLENAANLARCKADVERLQKEISIEGDIVMGVNELKVNPKHKLLETLSRRAVALSRMLHVHAEATEGESRDAGKKLKTEKAAKQAVTDDGLIPRLHAVK